jgi:hypothetical protein
MGAHLVAAATEINALIAPIRPEGGALTASFAMMEQSRD